MIEENKDGQTNRNLLKGGLHEKNYTLDISDSSNYVGVSMACGYIHKR